MDAKKLFLENSEAVEPHLCGRCNQVHNSSRFAPIATALHCLAAYCDRMAERYMRWHADALVSAVQGGLPQAMKQDAEHWMQRAALIREVAEKCK